MPRPGKKYFQLSSLQRIMIGVSFFFLTMVVAILGYLSFGWTLLDAVYMYVITIFGVGYGEVRPLTADYQRVFNIFVIVAGTSSAVYTIGGVVQMFTEGEINRALDIHRTSREISNLQQHVIICGFGRLGQVIAKQLKELQQPFVILDTDVERINLADGLGYLASLGSAAEEDSLKIVGIERAKALATVLPNDTMNVFITLTARNINQAIQIIARAEYPSTEAKLRLAGADHVLLPTAIGAAQMANLILRPKGLNFVEQTHDRGGINELLRQIDIQLEELLITSDCPHTGRAINDLEVRGVGSFIIVAVRRPDGRLLTKLSHNPVLILGDTLIVLGHNGDTPQYVREVSIKSKLHYRGVHS
ncbi:potassium channel protein [Thermosynechococcaceae cyanobacterium BACA0444]|uniref:Potassium channel protein n=1 Tax=Pseudocalidococcus azoricus BACA0444 TaxID=2918990 RepID=A0AAE4FPT1_9CYAN|nr:potassium channel protein [Pseudocalidococcus azoricus]MDS3859448.1 potassium channel protein [Pseudocalidococcus azoricus BACA0444]